jgi:hypothetical protein
MNDLRPKKEELQEFMVDYPQDTAFSAYARLLQSKWRTKRNFSFQKLGNFLEMPFAKESKANYLTANIKEFVTNEIKSAKINGALIGEPRIWNNLLSSQPLCFNLFGEMVYNKGLANKLFQNLFPKIVDVVTDIKFEFSPGRGSSKYTNDNSAFDVFIEYKRAEITGFLGIEVKYAESLREETIKKAEKNYREEYIKWAINSNVFKMDCIESLKKPPLSQIWRDHLLSIATKQDYNEGSFVFLFPKNNEQCKNGVEKYKECLTTEDKLISGFLPMYLEDLIYELRKLNDCNWTKELEERYLGTDILGN